MLIISIIYNVIAIVVFNNTTSIAFATILTLVTWVIYSTNDLKNVTNDKRIYIYVLIDNNFFMLCTFF